MAYTVKKWARARADYETGEFSVEKLSKKHRISTPSINTRIKRDKWKKALLKPEIERTTQEIYKEAFAKLGFDEEKAAKVVLSLANSNNVKAMNNSITQRSKLTGDYAAEKKEVKIKGPVNVNVTFVKPGQSA